VKNVLVTGANGFTGSYLTRALLEKGDRVRVLVRENSTLSAIADLPVEKVFGDLADGRSLSSDIMDGIDIVYHVAAAYRAENVPQRYFWDVNVDGTEALLKMALEKRVERFVHCSTVGVQGEIRNPPATEEHPYNPGDYYQESKLKGERLAVEYFHNRGLCGSVVRPVGIYGPGDTRFLKLFKFIRNGKFRMIGSGKVLYHLTYVTDLVQGILLAGEHPKAVGEVFTIGGEVYTSLQTLVEKIAAILDRQLPSVHIPVWPVWLAGWMCEVVCKPFRISPPIYRRRVDFFLKDRAFDISKAKRILGYRPTVGLDEGLAKTARWYIDNGLI
jgi:nucleoside-diphosphate-sugar epimerase